ncbi:MAG TPA: hypothetical protein VI731_03520 [Bacteroidia bacterium]|nr:hypothetical protein [Bacteroidia bacterium]
MSDSKKYQLQDLIERIEAVDRMLKEHASNPSSFMIEQYEAKKIKLLGYLIDELVDSRLRSPYSLHLVSLALKKFYPDLTKAGKSKRINNRLDKSYKELKALETVLAA